MTGEKNFMRKGKVGDWKNFFSGMSNGFLVVYACLLGAKLPLQFTLSVRPSDMVVLWHTQPLSFLGVHFTVVYGRNF